MHGRRREVKAEDVDRRFLVLNAIQSGAKRFSEIWTDQLVGEVIHSKVTLSRYLKALENEGVIKRNPVSHKHVEYEIAAGEQSSWALAAHELGNYPFDVNAFQLILRKIRDKASGLDIALHYAFNRFFDEEIDNATAKIMGGMPQYRKALTEAMEFKHTSLDKINEDWSDDMITWRSRRYYMFLKNLRDLLLKEPEHVKAYLKERPWLSHPNENAKTHTIVERILVEKYPHQLGALELKHALRQELKS